MENTERNIMLYIWGRKINSDMFKVTYVILKINTCLSRTNLKIQFLSLNLYIIKFWPTGTIHIYRNRRATRSSTTPAVTRTRIVSGRDVTSTMSADSLPLNMRTSSTNDAHLSCSYRRCRLNRWNIHIFNLKIQKPLEMGLCG